MSLSHSLIRLVMTVTDRRGPKDDLLKASHRSHQVIVPLNVKCHFVSRQGNGRFRYLLPTASLQLKNVPNISSLYTQLSHDSVSVKIADMAKILRLLTTSTKSRELSS